MGERPPFSDIALQLRQLDVPMLESLPDNLDQYDVIVDAIFGYNLKGDLREPFASIIASLASCSVPIVSVDFPSGWDCDSGKPSSTERSINPDCLIPIIAPVT